jgi:hypothetical protein
VCGFPAQLAGQGFQCFDIAVVAGFLNAFAPFHLRHQEIHRHAGVGFFLGVAALQRQQIAGAAQGDLSVW